MKLISPVILESNKGNIIKYNLTCKFFKKKFMISIFQMSIKTSLKSGNTKIMRQF